MTHLPYQAPGPKLEMEADYVVVGSGAGGAMAAVTLARAGRSVILVEAGAWRDPEDYPSSTYGALRDLFDDFGTTVTMGRALWPIIQARTVGGTTVINSAISVRTPPDIFQLWERELGLPRSELEAPSWRYQDQVRDELFVEPVPVGSRGRSNELAMIGANKVGYANHVMERYVKGCAGSGQCLQGCRAGKKQSTNLNYVPEVRTRGGTVLSSAPVDRIVLEGRRAIGVSGHFAHPATKKKGAAFFVRAKSAVFIAASVTQSPVLLERSGIRVPLLGQLFRSHPGTGLFGVYDEPIDMAIGATQGWASTAFRDSPGLKLETLAIPPEMVAGRLAGAGTTLMGRVKQMRNLAMWVHAVRAESVGTVKAGVFGKPMVSYTLNRADMQRMKDGFPIIARTHFEAGAKAVIPGVFGFPYSIGPDELSKLDDLPLEPRRYIAILSHLFGGCVMGRDEKSGVVDVRGRVFGVEGLIVADASVIPTTLGVNPQHTIMGLAGLFAERALS